MDLIGLFSAKRLNDKIVGVMPNMLETFINDFLDCLDSELKGYL